MSTPTMTTTFTPGILIMAIVPRDQGETVMSVAKRAGARGGTIMLGHSTVENKLWLLLGLDSKETEIVFTLLSHDEFAPVLAALEHDEQMRKIAAGAAICVNVGGILRHVCLPLPGVPAASQEPESPVPNPESGSSPMSHNATHELIAVIVNAGYAGDIMDAARKAGAPGGTIINARGTGREEDVKFFGITIVPEKEFIMIIAPKEHSGNILEAVKQTPCLTEPGIGIAFCMDVEQFLPLGRQTAKSKG